MMIKTNLSYLDVKNAFTKAFLDMDATHFYRLDEESIRMIGVITKFSKEGSHHCFLKIKSNQYVRGIEEVIKDSYEQNISLDMWDTEFIDAFPTSLTSFKLNLTISENERNGKKSFYCVPESFREDSISKYYRNVRTLSIDIIEQPAAILNIIHKMLIILNVEYTLAELDKLAKLTNGDISKIIPTVFSSLNFDINENEKSTKLEDFMNILGLTDNLVGCSITEKAAKFDKIKEIFDIE